MGYINLISSKPVHLELAKQPVVKHVLRGNPWLFNDAFKELPRAQPGSIALVKDSRRDIIGKGIYDPDSAIAVRMVALRPSLDNELVQQRLDRALRLRRLLFRASKETNCFRLINGEGGWGQWHAHSGTAAPANKASAACLLPQVTVFQAW